MKSAPALTVLAAALALLGGTVARAAPAMSAPPAIEALDLPDRFVLAVTVKRSGTQTQPAGTRTWTLDQTYRADAKATGDGYRVQMTSLDTQSTGEPPVEAAAMLLAGQIAWRTEGSLSPTAIENWPGVAEGIRKTVRETTTLNMPAQTRTLLGNAMTSLSAETAAISFLLPQTYLSYPQGYVLKPGKTLTYRGEVGNPLGGDLITSVNTILLERERTPAGRSVVIWKQTVDPEAARAVIRSTMALVTSRNGRAVSQAALERFTFERVDSCRYEIDLATGLTAMADCEIRVDVDAGDGVNFNRMIQRMVMTQEIVAR
jgi:hypothetical protein